MPTKDAPKRAVAQINQKVFLFIFAITKVHGERHSSRTGYQYKGHDRNQDQWDGITTKKRVRKFRFELAMVRWSSAEH